jgi:enamine deaminase RidA (YjgF/YER057c/UK114 family)
MTRDAVFPEGRQALNETNRYSAAIRSGDLLFISGQVGSREDGSAEPDFAKQVQLAFDNLWQYWSRRVAALTSLT